MRLAIVSDVVAPYRTELFAAVGSIIPEMHVCFQAVVEANRSWESRPSPPFPHMHMRGYRLPLPGRTLLVHWSLAHHLKRYQPDVIVSYGFSTATVQCAQYAHRTRRPFLIANDGTPWTDPMSGIEFRYRSQLVRMASGLIAASGSAGSYFELLGAPRSKITVVELTRDLVTARRRVEGIRKRSAAVRAPHRVAMVARLVPNKHIADGCAAALEASNRIPGLVVRIAGDGPMRRELEEWARRNGQGRITVAGLLSWDQMLDLYADSDVLLFPATEEKFGMVVIEALACGVPVVAYDRGGAARDLIVDGMNGFLVREGDVAGLATRLAEAMSSAENLARMRMQAMGVVEKHDVLKEAQRFARAVMESQGATASGSAQGQNLELDRTLAEMASSGMR